MTMLSAKLVRMIEDHAEELFRGLIDDLHHNDRTPTYHRIDRDSLRTRLYDVYHNLGRWLAHSTDENVEAAYTALGRKRFQEGVPLSEVVYALVVTKNHLLDFTRAHGLMDSAIELYQEQELYRLVGRFFDRAIYHTVRGYEHECSHGARTAA